ncbi:histidine kinase [Streptomyces sp. NPDC048606]|uniref:sensor histidine kinase n=1 Tax=Streptomyces sp. NPDC048606 TaxID=3154726 RepID=UPI00342D9C2A
MQPWGAVGRRTKRWGERWGGRWGERVSGSPGARPFGERGTLGLLGVLLAPGVGEAGRLASAPAPCLAALLVIVAAVAVERTVPLLSLLLAASLSLLYPWLGSSVWTAFAALVLSFLAGTRQGPSAPARAHLVFAGVALCGLPLTAGFAQPKDWLSVLVVGFATAVLPWWVGYWWSRRAALMHAGWERAERLEWRQRQVAEQARLKERSRIAEDIHDSLGHELSVMALLSGALELARGMPEEHRATVAQLRERCTRASEQLHEVIGLLRDEGGGSSPLTPSDESIVDLVRRFERSATGAVRYVEEGGDLPPLGLLADRAAYRVVQEALTNATKHAPGSAVTVRVTHRARETVVWVFDKPAGGADAADAPVAVGSGSGLIGLDERVRLAGGSLRAGPASGGFEVLARLPRGRGDGADTVAPYPYPYPDADPYPLPGTGTDADAGSRPEGEALPGPGHVRAALVRARAALRREVGRAARIPVFVGAGLATLLVGFYVFTSALTSLDPEDYARIQPGRQRTELATLLPERSISKPPPILSEPPVPPGAACEYYRTGGSLLRISDRMYRLCFKDDLLVAKDML